MTNTLLAGWKLFQEYFASATSVAQGMAISVRLAPVSYNVVDMDYEDRLAAAGDDD